MSFRSPIRIFTLLFFVLGFAAGLTAQSTAHDQGTHTQIVNMYPTQMALTANPQSVTSGTGVVFAAVLTEAGGPGIASPTGTVTFSIGNTVLGTLNVVNGAATLTNAPPVGTDTVVAAYSGDLNYKPASAQTSVTVLTPPPPGSPDFDFTLPAVTVTAGQAFNGNITIQPVNGFTGRITFTSGALPQEVTFAFPSSPSVGVVANSEQTAASQTVAFTIGTQGVAVTVASGLLLLGSFGVRRRPRWFSYAVLAIFFAGVLSSVVGCAGNRFLQTPGTPPGTYTIPITGTSGSLAHTHNLTLIVKAAS
jgi:Bacterial Ig-like domain (group 3)